jgi:hypothetical protein
MQWGQGAGDWPGEVPSARRIGVILAVAVFNHVVLDLAFTIYRYYTRPMVELNPLWRGLLATNPLLLVAWHLAIGAVIVGLLALSFHFIYRADEPDARRIARFVYWGAVGFMLWGFFITSHHVWFLLRRILVE